MRNIIKRTTRVLGGMILLALLVGMALYPIGLGKLTRSYPNLPAETLKVSGDMDAVSRGKHVAVIWGCTQCHGENLSGTVVVDNLLLGTIAASNLTTGKGGITPSYTDSDWIRAVRHGVKPDGRVELLMSDYSGMSDRDLSDLISYLDQIPQIDSDHPAVRFGPILPTVSALGLFTPAAERIDHGVPRPADPMPSVTREYGQYLYALCTECHSPKSASKLAKSSQEEFVRAIRTGLTRNGKPIAQAMPPERYGEMNETELDALWLYVQSPTVGLSQK